MKGAKEHTWTLPAPATGTYATATLRFIVIAGVILIELNKYGILYFSDFPCPTPNPWEYMEVQLPYIKKQTAKTIVLAVYQFFLNFIYSILLIQF